MHRALAVSFAAGLAACSLLLEDGYSSGDRSIGGDPADQNGGGSTSGGGPAGAEAGPEDSEPDYRAMVLADGPVAYWPLDETSGTVVNDVSGHGNDGELDPRGRWGAKGIPGSKGTSLSLDGQGGVTIGDKLDFPGRTPFTLEAWIRPTTPVTTWRIVFDKLDRQGGNPFKGTYLWVNNDDPTPLTLERWSGGSIRQLAASRAAVATDRFTHVVAVVDESRSSLFVDGVRVNSEVHTGDIPDTSRALSLGPNWVGELDELAIYDKALDEDRIAAHYRTGAGKP
jgi:hypothetical protein